MGYRQTVWLVLARWLRMNELNQILSHRALVSMEKMLWVGENSTFPNAYTHHALTVALWVALGHTYSFFEHQANFRCKGYVQSCFPALHLCHKQCSTVEKGSTSCYRMAWFLFHCLCYWGKGLWRRCACHSFGTWFCQAWEWSDFIIKVFPGLTNRQVKFYSSWKKPYKTLRMVPSGCSRTLSPLY